MKLKSIIDTLEHFAPLQLQESYDNCGLQIGNPDCDTAAALLCLDVTEQVMAEAVERNCDLIISHHPLLFKGLKHITGSTPTERIAAEAIRHGIAVYSAHTNLDSAANGVSHEMAQMLGLRNCRVLRENAAFPARGLGMVGDISPLPVMEFLRKVKETFSVRALRYSDTTAKLVVRKVALCGGAGAEFIKDAIDAGADVYVTGDVRYHDFITWSSDILIADIGHYESESCAPKLFSRILRENFPDYVAHISQTDTNPVRVI